jgi:hypothetical protein
LKQALEDTKTNQLVYKTTINENKIKKVVSEFVESKVDEKVETKPKSEKK